MPRKTKDIKDEIESVVVKPTTKKSKTSSKSDVKKTSSSKKSSLSKTTNKTSKTSKTSTSTKKGNTKSTKASSSKKTTTTKPKTDNSKVKKTTTKKVKAKEAKMSDVLEYYDLPYRYNETTVRILAQTPKKLFIYWDISDEDRKNYINKFDSDFFNNTVPVLIVHNDSNNSTFEVEINDFANCWYLDINDTKCKYTIELGRRPKKHDYHIPNNYVFVTSSNIIESPNDHILFEKLSNTIYFRNVKNNTITSKEIANLSFIRNIGKIYSIYDAYHKLYNKIYSNGEIDNFDLANPSSGNPTSTFNKNG